MSHSITVTQLSGFDRNKPQSFDGLSVTIGTDAGSDVRFDPTWDKTVSGHHGRVVWEDGGCWYVDAESRDCSLIDGEKVQRRKLSSGTVVELGKGGPRIKIEFTGAAEVPTPQPAATPAARPATTAAAGRATPPPASSSNNVAAVMVGGAVAVILVAAALGWFFLRGGGDDPAEQLAKVAQQKQAAVGVVAIPDPENPAAGLRGNGTAWAIAPRVFVANAAIVWLTSEFMGQGIDTMIVVQGEDGPLQLRVTGTRLHPQRENMTPGPVDALPVVSPYDLGLLLVEGDAPEWFEIAPADDLLAMAAGMPVGFMAHTREVSLGDPKPRSGAGTVVAMTGFEAEAADPGQRYLIEYDLPVEPDMSGGPIFDVAGNAVGLLTIPMHGSTESEDRASPKRYGQRIDLLRELWSDYPAD